MDIKSENSDSDVHSIEELPTLSLPIVRNISEDQKDAHHVFERLSNLVLGGPAHYSASVAADRAGVEFEKAKLLWKALGLAAELEDIAFTDGDVAALKRMHSLIEEGVVNWETATDIAKSLRRMVSRMTEWQVSALMDFIQERAPRKKNQVLDEHFFEHLEVNVRELLPSLERLLRYTWRKEFARSLEHVAVLLVENQNTYLNMCVGFADIADFTSFSRHLDEKMLKKIIEKFESEFEDRIAQYSGRIIKTLGDEVFFLLNSAHDAAHFSMNVHNVFKDDDDIRLRMGLSFGSVIQYGGDAYGITVNTASRLTAIAKTGTTFVSESFKQQFEKEVHPVLPKVTSKILKKMKNIKKDTFSFEKLDRKNLKGLGEVIPYLLINRKNKQTKNV